ncbi:MAG: hypothetical protein GX647_01980 [Clostridiales bacterium]|nr:hypothetical protein [Clostridiales bacterium]
MPYGFACTADGLEENAAIRPLSWLSTSSTKLLDAWDRIKIVGAAPELPGAMALGRELRRRNIVASIAHSDADYDTVAEALENGHTDVTHIYSGCSIVHRVNAFRVACVVESGFLFDELTASSRTPPSGTSLRAAS